MYEPKQVVMVYERPWWDGEMYEYSLESLTDEIVEIKRDRYCKVLSEDSYDFVVFVQQLV